MKQSLEGTTSFMGLLITAEPQKILSCRNSLNEGYIHVSLRKSGKLLSYKDLNAFFMKKETFCVFEFNYSELNILSILYQIIKKYPTYTLSRQRIEELAPFLFFTWPLATS